MDTSKITIIVLNWNNKQATIGCIESLQRANLQGATILPVDNGSRDGSVAALQARFPDLHVLCLPQNVGYAGGNNAGIKAAMNAGAEAVLLLNNDTEVSPDFLLPLTWAMDSHPMVAGVCSAIHRHDRPDMLDVAYCLTRFGQRDAVQIIGVNALPGQGFEERREIEIAIGCSLMLRTDVLRQVGLLDERYFAYHEDVDWCLRAHKLGYRFLYEPLSRVFHKPSSSTSQIQEGDAPATYTESATDLPNAEALPWNPIRTYLGARNMVRLLQTYATPQERRSFVLSCAYEIPLEICAIVFDREGWMRLGRWSYGDAARLIVENRPWTFPGRLWNAVQQGRLTQLRYQLRGFWDGVRDRPLPLQWLGLR